MSDSVPDTKRETITLHELLERSAESALELQREDGSFPPGRNYTYDEPETPVRTTSHWTVTLSEVYDITGKNKFREAANAAVDYLLSDEVRPHGYTYYCRDAPGKDRCNGLVGQARPILGLTYAGGILNREDAINTAEKVFLHHPFNKRMGAWEKIEVDGEKMSFDRTLNHQLIFAKSAIYLAKRKSKVSKNIVLFLDKLKNNMRIYDDGLIKHYIYNELFYSFNLIFDSVRHKSLIQNKIASIYYDITKQKRKKEIGYHSINIQALGMLRQHYSNHSLWKINKINHAIEFAKSNYYQSKMYQIVPGATNPGLLVASGLYNLSCGEQEKIKKLVEENLRKKIDPDTYLLSSDAISNPDQAASISILTTLPNMSVTL